VYGALESVAVLWRLRSYRVIIIIIIIIIIINVTICLDTGIGAATWYGSANIAMSLKWCVYVCVYVCGSVSGWVGGCVQRKPLIGMT